ncbi:MAG: phosphodiester glycosidase family protein [Candidatus Kerfeldbacteria bacterium]|nr:phosphodiester glycosidase family protein [Candidatus Kerfeldbacteria bacterium]
MRKTSILFFVGLGIGLFWSFHTTPQVHATTLAERYSGYVLLDVTNHGEAWYVYPKTLHRFYLGTGTDAFNIMRFLGAGMTNSNLAKIPTDSQDFSGDLALRERFKGRILLQVEENGEAWYVNPRNLKRYFLGRPDEALRILAELAAGITATRLVEIPIATDFSLVPGQIQTFRDYALTIPRDTFNIQVAALGRSSFRLVTDTAELADCDGGCDAKSLQAYVQENGGFAGMNGTYFCPPDYPQCADKEYSFLPPVYNPAADVMLQEDVLPFHAGPMIVEYSDRTVSYYHRTISFGYSVAENEQRSGKTVVAAIANYPSLVENGSIVVGSEPLSADQNTKAVRDAIGYNNNAWFLVRARSASVPDMAYILDSLGATYAMNLDGGGSSALYYDGAYKAGPGRLLPNAVLLNLR